MEDPLFDAQDTTDKYPVGTKVELYGWPTGAMVIGHCGDGAPIIQPEPCRVSDDQIFSSNTGRPRIIL